MVTGNVGSQPLADIDIIGSTTEGIAYYIFQPSFIMLLVLLTFTVVETSAVGVLQIPGTNTVIYEALLAKD